MGLLSFFGLGQSTPAEVDHLSEGHALSSYALSAFDSVKEDLALSVTHFDAVKAEAVAEIAKLQARHDEAHSAQAKSEHVLGKIKDLLGEA